MAGESSRIKWIEIGYEFFCEEGPEGIQVERLARAIGLNKSGFYYYFGTPEIYLQELLNYQSDRVDEFLAEIPRLKDFNEYLNHLLKNKETVLFHVQLSRHRHKKIFFELYNTSNKKQDSLLAPMWANFLGIENNLSLAQKYFTHLRDVFFTRVTHKNLTYDFLIGIVTEFQYIIRQIKLSELKTESKKR